MQPGTRHEGGQVLQEFQRAHHEMGGAIAVRGFELEDDLAGWGPAQAFVAQGRARDVTTELFEFFRCWGPQSTMSQALKREAEIKSLDRYAKQKLTWRSLSDFYAF